MISVSTVNPKTRQGGSNMIEGSVTIVHILLPFGSIQCDPARCDFADPEDIRHSWYNHAECRNWYDC